MKKVILISLSLCLSLSLFAQVPEAFKYQAALRDDNGVSLSNALVSVRISILKTTQTGTLMYQETHTITTNDFGLIFLNIGEGGDVTGDFSLIEWGDDIHFIKTEVDLGTGFADMGTTQLLSVPYALCSNENDPVFEVSPAAGITGSDISNWNSMISSQWLNNTPHIYFQGGNVGVGLSAPVGLLHTYGNGIGEGNVLFEGIYKGTPGDPPATGGGTRMMWYPDKASFRAGRVTSTQWDKASIGNFSFAGGENTTASGHNSFAFGQTSTASGARSAAWGSQNTASGEAATAWGKNNAASGNFSTAMGEENIAPTYAEVTIGRFATTYVHSGTGETNWTDTDRLFSIGNGTGSATRSNALTLMKNGNMGLGVDNPLNHRLYIRSAGTTQTGATVNIENTASNGMALNIATSTTEGSVLITQEGTGYAFRCDYLSPLRTVFVVMGDNVGIGVGSPTDRLVVFNGTTTGRYTTTGWTHASDQRNKKNILNLEPSLEKLLLLSPKRYDYLNEETNNSSHIGFIAQDLEQLFPEFVHTDAEGMKSIAYGQMVPVLVQSIQEQQAQIEMLMEMILEQQKRIEMLEGK